MKQKLFRLVALILALSMLAILPGCTILGKEIKLPNFASLLPGKKLPQAVAGVDSDVFYGFETYVNEHGYTDCVFKRADVTDFEQDEVVGLCRNNGVWYGLVSVRFNDEYRSLFCEDVTDMAMYLVEQNGKGYVMTYTQSMAQTADGGSNMTNRYQLFRYNTAGEKDILEEKEVTYNSNSSDATAVAEFFAACNGYLANGDVIVDPYRLQGKAWLGSADYGSIPDDSLIEDQQNTPAYPPEDGEEMLGFVQINDPKSWLNLREGPGTNYPCVYTEPGNKKSIVKQAQGSPVTILETIETGDAKNPVWVKVRITYAGQEIVGYSSKKYIRVAE